MGAAFQTALLVASAAAGVVLGFRIPLRYGGELAGFDAGVLLGGIVSLLCGLMLGYLFGGWGEDLLGSAIGLPAGMFAGCFLGVATASFVFGWIGRLVSGSL